jgi:serine/threonine protein kinase
MFLGSGGSGRVECPAVGPENASHRIGRYEIRRELGRGMMGVVYEAWDPTLGRRVALKTVKAVAPSRAERDAWEQRFLSEARAAARLSHPCIVVVHDVGRDPDSDVLFMALEYLEGETLAEKITTGKPMPWREALRIVGRVADALHHAHGQGVVHRDVKPANVMILRSGEPKILDFGIARLDAGSLTMPGDLFGTPLYMSPEQAAGDTVGARSDLFSLGSITWALLTGSTPFGASSVPAILSRVMLRDPQPPSELVAGIPAAVDRIVARAMAKLPEDRYPDGQSLADDIDDALAGREPRHLVEWAPPRTGERTISSARLRSDLVLAELEERKKQEEAAPTVPPKPRPSRLRLRAFLMLVLVACAGVFLYLHPGHVTILTALARRARDSRLAAAVVQLLATRASPTPGLSPLPSGPGAFPAMTPSPAESPASAAEARGLAEGRGAEPTPPDHDGTATAVEPTPEEAETPIGGPLKPPAPPAAGGMAPAASTATRAATPSPAAQAAAPSPAPPTPTAAASSVGGGPTTAGVTPPPKAKRPSRPRPIAFLSVGFEHRLKSGVLEVWVDGRRVARETLDSRVTTKLLVFEERKGSVQQTLQLSPGRHSVRVRVRSGGETKTASTARLFEADSTRRLEVRISRLSGKISLDWK